MLVDEKWPIARLIPVTSATGVEAQERNAASALLSVASAVKEFGRALVKPLGAPAGKIMTFVETPFDFEGKKVRPDGLIVVTRGSKSWVALVEAKVGSSSLTQEQMNSYLDLARDRRYDAVLSISNHYVTSSSAYPIEVDKRKTRRVTLRHRSWVDLLTEAVVQKEHRGVSDPDQAYILGELIRYLSDPRSGVVTFNSMGPGWTTVKDGARSQTLRKSDSEVSDVAARWDELVRYLCLHMTMDLGRDVKQQLSAKESAPSVRLASLRNSLASAGTLHADLKVPDTVASIQLVADLRARQVITTCNLDAPSSGRSRGRVSWLLRQLADAPDSARIEAKIARSQASLAESLTTVRERPETLHPEGTREIRSFSISLSRDMGLKKDAGKGSFIQSVIEATEDFYRDVLQNLHAWKAPPPKLKPKEPEEEALAAVEEAAVRPRQQVGSRRE